MTTFSSCSISVSGEADAPSARDLPGRALSVCLILLCLSVALFADDPRLVIDSGGHQAVITFVTFTHDGKYLVSAGDDKVVRIWDIGTGKTVRTIRGQMGDWDEGKSMPQPYRPMTGTWP
jgi:WD40 repeat protein